MGGRWSRAMRRAAIVVVMVAAAVLVYYASVVMRARAVTEERIGAALRDADIVLRPGDLAPDRLDALMAVQDPGFRSHGGTDFRRGTMTTITQALVKRYYFDRFRPGLAKIRQSLIARFALDPLVAKDEQLTLFLNTVYLGTFRDREVNGLADGAAFFFEKRFEDLSTDEYFALLATIDAPNRFDPKRHPHRNARRVLQIRRLLAGECARGGIWTREPTCFSEDPVPSGL